ncbi:DUF1656 domain-containing protein [Rhizobium sp. WYJ-E13]|uniref:DUF1656 domain-containing protein n=1 Tax=Rhizobium sp. WYJ-E13 TaxID=2849093 RepID=UPI001C1F0E86|nr:DUF1656 domain-containing protein [Rhizobium sp. WYJ-E13]QWW71139.1 DUF1656 domain-containing protein [Rhizobium sp. WYJ-E13]
MTGQLDLYGVFLPSLGVFALLAYGVFRALAWLLGKVGFYSAVWHRPLFNLALYISLVGMFSVASNWTSR